MNRREFFKMIFGVGVACVLPRVVEVEVEQVPGVITLPDLTDEQLELREQFTELAESNCVGKVRMVPKCNSRVNWKYIDPSLMVDRSSGVLLNRDGTIAGLIHNIGS